MATALGPKLGLLVHAALGDEHYDELTALLRAIDALLQCNVIAHTEVTPPGSPSDGDCYIVGADATGDWATRDNEIARWSAVVSAWEFYEPAPGWIAWSNEAGGHLKFIGASGWVSLSAEPETAPTGFEVAGGSAVLFTTTNPNDSVQENGGWYSSGQGRGYARGTGKRYFEFFPLVYTTMTRDLVLGFVEQAYFGGYNEAADSYLSFGQPGGQVNPNQEIRSEGTLLHSDFPTFYSMAPIMFAVDFDAGEFWVGYGGYWYIGDPATGTDGFAFSHSPGNMYRPVAAFYNSANQALLMATADALTQPLPAGFIPWNDPE